MPGEGEPGTPFSQDKDDVLLRVRVQPRASRNCIRREPDGRIRVALNAPPVEGKANKALCAFLAKQFGLSKSAVLLESGERSRDKTLRLRNARAAEVEGMVDQLHPPE